MDGVVERIGVFALVGLGSGFVSGLFGIGGGIVRIPLFVYLLPLFGVAFNLAAYVMNRQHPGLYRTISRVTLVAAVIWSLFGLWVVVNYGGQEIK